MAYMLRLIILFALADFAIPAIFNGTFDPLTQVNATGEENAIITRRKGKGKAKNDRSTSSSSNEKKGGDSSDSGHSLELSLTDSSASDKKHKKPPKKDYKPKSSRERTGWRKWHRKCQQCPEDMRMKWRDPNIKWICGAYQRARRSFKSLCMMHYRNCQDGTMFTKIADHRCPNASDVLNHGDHFFYDYKVDLSIDPSNSEDSSSSKSSSKSSEKSSESLNSERVASLENLVMNDLVKRKEKRF